MSLRGAKLRSNLDVGWHVCPRYDRGCFVAWLPTRNSQNACTGGGRVRGMQSQFEPQITQTPQIKPQIEILLFAR